MNNMDQYEIKEFGIRLKAKCLSIILNIFSKISKF